MAGSAAFEGGFAIGVHVNNPSSLKLGGKEVGMLLNKKVRLKNQELSVFHEGQTNVGQNLQSGLLCSAIRFTSGACW